MEGDIVDNTITHLESINFEEVSERWIASVIDSEFTDPTIEHPSLSLGVLFTGDPVETLLNIGRVCDAWKILSAVNDESRANNTSFRLENSFFTTLYASHFTPKRIQTFVYFLCCKAAKSSSSFEDKKIGLLAVKFYLQCMQIPGCQAFKFYHCNLFRWCLECLQVPALDESEESINKWNQFEQLLPEFIMVLENLLPLLDVFQLDEETVEIVISKLSCMLATEVTRKEFDFELDFLKMPNTERERYDYSMTVTSLAFQGLLILMNHDLNGEKEVIYKLVLDSYLTLHILCHRVPDERPITAKHLAVKDHVAAFISHNLKDKNEVYSILTREFLKRQCIQVQNKADFRFHVSGSVKSIMFHLRVHDLVNLIQWLFELVNSNDPEQRNMGLEVFNHILDNIPPVDTEELPEEMKVYFGYIPYIFAVLVRCEDKSTPVRTRALIMIRLHMNKVLKSLTERKEPFNPPEEVFDDEVLEEQLEEPVIKNGIHRQYWYKMTTLKKILDEIVQIFHRRSDDSNSLARKVALQAMENVILFDLEYLTSENMRLFSRGSKDDTIVVRKQTVLSLQNILGVYPTMPVSQEYWLRGVLPLVRDPEDSVRRSVLTAVEDKFLHQIVSDSETDQYIVFCMLKILASGDLFRFQVYLRKAFGLWKTDDKLMPQIAGQLEKSLSRGNDDEIWLYLLIFASVCKLPSQICQLAVKEFEKPQNWERLAFIENILRVIGCICSWLDKETLETISSVLSEKVESYTAPVEILNIIIQVLSEIEKQLKNEEEFSNFAAKMIQSAVDNLSPLTESDKKGEKETFVSEDLAIKSFTVIKEFCHIFPSNITIQLIDLLKHFFYKSSKANAAASFRKEVNSTLKSHAITALGMLSLQKNTLANELLPLLSDELIEFNEGKDSNDMIRNSVVVNLLGICKRYPSHADTYVPYVFNCFRDNRFVIRLQCIKLVVGLVQEDFYKCGGNFLYCMLSTLIDEREEIQDMGKFCLSALLHTKNKKIFVEHFTKCIFIFNHYVPEENIFNYDLARTVEQLGQFAIGAENHRELRLHIYKFMLNHMTWEDKVPLVQELCNDIFACIAEEIWPINPVTIPVIRDCFDILSSMEIRAYDSESVAEGLEEEQQDKVIESEHNFRLVTLVVPVINKLIQMKEIIWKSKTRLLEDMLRFLKDIVKDYGDHLQLLLGNDKHLLQQVQWHLNEQNKDTKLEKPKVAIIVPSTPLQDRVQELIEQDRIRVALRTAERNANVRLGVSRPRHDASARNTPARDRASTSRGRGSRVFRNMPSTSKD